MFDKILISVKKVSFIGIVLFVVLLVLFVQFAIVVEAESPTPAPTEFMPTPTPLEVLPTPTLANDTDRIIEVLTFNNEVMILCFGVVDGLIIALLIAKGVKK